MGLVPAVVDLAPARVRLSTAVVDHVPGPVSLVPDLMEIAPAIVDLAPRIRGSRPRGRLHTFFRVSPATALVLHENLPVYAPTQARGVHRFGDFELDPGRRRLTNRGSLVYLAPRNMAVLLVLVARAGQIVPKDTLVDAAWARHDAPR